jgi:hypothetical protein
VLLFIMTLKGLYKLHNFDGPYGNVEAFVRCQRVFSSIRSLQKKIKVLMEEVVMIIARFDESYIVLERNFNT